VSPLLTTHPNTKVSNTEVTSGKSTAILKLKEQMKAYILNFLKKKKENSPRKSKYQNINSILLRVLILVGALFGGIIQSEQRSPREAPSHQYVRLLSAALQLFVSLLRTSSGGACQINEKEF
jgi:uncharacterized membrane protein